MLKTCTKCDEEKPLDKSNFSLRGSGKWRGICKACRSIAYREYYRKNRKKKIEYQKKYSKQNRDAVLANKRSYYVRNKDKLSEKGRDYRKKNWDKIKARKRAYRRIKRATDPAFKMARMVSNSVYKAIKHSGGCKGGDSVWNNLPYSADDLKSHIESLWEPWMGWHNHGKYCSDKWDDSDSSTWTWQIDHIIPQSRLKFSSMKHPNFIKCWNLDNLRPLCAKKNNKKGDK